MTLNPDFILRTVLVILSTANLVLAIWNLCGVIEYQKKLRKMTIHILLTAAPELGNVKVETFVTEKDWGDDLDQG